MGKVRLLQRGSWKREITISHLLERKGCDEFTLLEDDMLFEDQRYEIWWYAYRGDNHIVAKQCDYPYILYFFLLEPGDLFRTRDFKTYMETGILMKPTVKMYQLKEHN